MKLEEYKSGNYIKMNDYKAFIPSNINYNWGWDDTKLDKLLAEANRQIGELNAYSLLIPNVDLYIKMHVKIEANKSSRIEGTRTTVEEDLIEKTGIKFTTLVGVINAFQERQILIETTGYSRNQVFAFQKYIDLFLK